MGNKEYLKERREWLHEHHFCVDCKKQDARTLMGRFRCYECSEKGRVRKYGLVLTRQERKDLGLCTMCMNPAKEGYSVCEECYQRVKKAWTSSHQPIFLETP